MALAMERPPITFARDSEALSLEELLGEARDAYAGELHFPLTVPRPPRLREAGEDDTPAEAGAQVGLSMSARLHRRLRHPEAYGNTFPMARAIDDLRGWCRGRHLEPRGGPWLDHTVDLRRGRELWSRIAGYRPLCARLTFYAVVHRVPLSRLARVEELSGARTEELLRRALAHTWHQRIEWAHVEGPDGSGAAEVMAQQRRERREERRSLEEARRRVDAARGAGVVCRYCGDPYDPHSTKPCRGSGELSEAAAAAYAELGATLLCSPADPS